MSLETIQRTRVRSPDQTRDKPLVDRIEHANLDRPGASLHPSAHARTTRVSRAGGWDRYLSTPAWH